MTEGIADALMMVKANVPANVTLVAVSKTKPEAAILEAYQAGQQHFGENRPQEMQAKSEALPEDIHWHMIGHLQRNKVKYIISFVYLIHGVDSERLLQEIDSRAASTGRIVDILLQGRIAKEETKYGLEYPELDGLCKQIRAGEYPNIRLRGLMGMATFSDNRDQVRAEFETLASWYKLKKEEMGEHFDTLSMGMSGDYDIAIEAGSTMVRVGSAIFGSR